MNDMLLLSNNAHSDGVNHASIVECYLIVCSSKSSQNTSMLKCTYIVLYNILSRNGLVFIIYAYMRCSLAYVLCIVFTLTQQYLTWMISDSSLEACSRFADNRCSTVVPLWHWNAPYSVLYHLSSLTVWNIWSTILDELNWITNQTNQLTDWLIRKIRKNKLGLLLLFFFPVFSHLYSFGYSSDNYFFFCFRFIIGISFVLFFCL